MHGRILAEPLVMQLADKHARTPAQIILRWDLQHEVITIPKSVTPARIQENSQLFDFQLSAADMAALDSLDRGERSGPDPFDFDF
jgi:diketogulonate reductase-like aldo/keto reductase